MFSWSLHNVCVCVHKSTFQFQKELRFNMFVSCWCLALWKSWRGSGLEVKRCWLCRDLFICQQTSRWQVLWLLNQQRICNKFIEDTPHTFLFLGLILCIRWGKENVMKVWKCTTFGCIHLRRTINLVVDLGYRHYGFFRFLTCSQCGQSCDSLLSRKCIQWSHCPKSMNFSNANTMFSKLLKTHSKLNDGKVHAFLL